jgi:hypothetical protein
MRSILNSKSRKAQDMSVSTIIIIIIAIVVLVFLVIAFTRGGGSLMDNIKNFFGGGTNVDTIKNACGAACSTNQVYEYCGKVRTLNMDDKTSFRGSCDTLGKQISNAGIEACSSIECPTAQLATCPENNWKDKGVKCGDAEDITASVQDSGTNNLKQRICCKAASSAPATDETVTP